MLLHLCGLLRELLLLTGERADRLSIARTSKTPGYSSGSPPPKDTAFTPFAAQSRTNATIASSVQVVPPPGARVE